MYIRNEELLAYTQQMANMIEAGIPLGKSLLALEAQEENGALKKVVKQVREEVEGGSTLSDAMARHPGVFSPFFVNMVFAGEQGAGLPVSLNRVADHLAKEAALRSKITGLFAYPVVVGVFALLIIIFLMVAVVPVFSKVYTQLGIDLPLPTRVLMGLSFFTRKYWLVWGGGLGLMYAGFRYMRKSAAGKEFLDWLVMNFPVLGKIIRKLAIARFVRTFGDMMACSVALTDSLEIVDKLVANSEISNVIQGIRESVQGGGTLSQAFSESGFFSQVVVQMTFAGEESGNIGAMLEKCADTLDHELEATAKKTILIMEPVLTLALAGVVGFIALSIYLPMFDLMKLVS